MHLNAKKNHNKAFFPLKNKAFSILHENHPNEVLISISFALLTCVR